MTYEIKAALEALELGVKRGDFEDYICSNTGECRPFPSEEELVGMLMRELDRVMDNYSVQRTEMRHQILGRTQTFKVVCERADTRLSCLTSALKAAKEGK